MRHRVVVDKLVTPYGTLQANAQIAGQAPFALSAEALLEGRWQDESFAVSATASGALDALRARGRSHRRPHPRAGRHRRDAVRQGCRSPIC